ncbi:MAG TPA: B12-binding domain-containing radical SAM protein [Spirochaetes bacterium]|nr:B12-binding domain-containing radical SAM protein [Spirochaetota bacterium]
MGKNDKKKILFVEPRGANSNVFDKYMTIPLLGPIYLATIAKQAGYDVAVINENILKREINSEELASIDILGLSCITTTVNRGKEIASDYRKIRKANGFESRTMIGGIHASMIPEDVEPHFDQIIVGEAENIILDVLSGKIKDKIVYTREYKDLDDLPFLNFDLLKESEKMNIFSIMTSRGCPYDCNFCTVTKMFGRGYRAQSPQRVMDEISGYKNGVIFFSDDHFAANIKRTDQILDLMMENGFNRPWSAQVRTEVTKNPEFIAKMKKAGCTTVYVGLESINLQSLKEMNKKQGLEDIERTIKVFHDNGIAIHGMFILGNDTDTKDVFERTSDFSIKTGLDYVQYSILTPLPGSRTYSQFEKEGRLLHKKWDFYDGLHVVYRPKNMTPDELQRGVLRCFKDFYSFPRAVKSAFNTTFKIAATTIKKTYKKAHFPSLRPTIMRLAGRGIIINWIDYNKAYLKYLYNLSHISPEGA